MTDELLEVGEAQHDTVVGVGRREAGDVADVLGARSCDRVTVATRDLARWKPVPVMLQRGSPLPPSRREVRLGPRVE